MTGAVGAREPRPSGVRPSHLLALGAWLGLAYGFLEALEFFVLGLVPGALAWRNGNSAPVFLVAPALYMVFYAFVGLLAVLLSRARPQWRWDIILAAALVTLSGYLGASLQGQLFSPMVSVILGVGMGAVAIRSLRSHALLLPRLIRSLPWLAAGVLVTGVLAVGSGLARERLALAATPEHAPDGPNVLVLVLDTQRADHLGFQGY